MAAKKEILKSVRMTQEVFRYIDGFEGDGFNQKFENLVLFCMKAEDEKKRTLSLYDSLIDSRKDVLEKIRTSQSIVDSMLFHLDLASKKCELLFNSFKKS